MIKNDPSRLIEGYEKESLLPLEEALQPFYGQTDRLSGQLNMSKTNAIVHRNMVLRETNLLPFTFIQCVEMKVVFTIILNVHEDRTIDHK